MLKDLNCDIEHVLQSRDFSVLQKLISHCCSFRDKIATEIEDIAVYEIGSIEKTTQTINKISELEHEIESLRPEIDTTKLQLKIVDKKITNAVNQQEKLKAEIEDAKSKKESLSLEMVDLQQESEKRKEDKLLKWDAIKRVCYIYKHYLDFHIQLVDSDEHEKIKVSFFTNDDNMKDKYYVYLTCLNNQWKVEQIQPVLKVEYLKEFKGIIDFSKQSEVSDVTAFLCKLRHVFVKYYLNIEQ